MKVKDMIFALERMNPELDIYYHTEDDLDSIDKITGFNRQLILNMKDIDINCEECKKFNPDEPSKCSSGHLLKEGSQGVECPDYQPNIPNKKVYMLEVCVRGNNPHFQEIFINELLARQARAKYLSDPACKRKIMGANVLAFKVHTDLTILDSVTKDDS